MFSFEDAGRDDISDLTLLVPHVANAEDVIERSYPRGDMLSVGVTINGDDGPEDCMCALSASTNRAAAARGSASRKVGVGFCESFRMGCASSLLLGDKCPLIGVL